MSTTDTDFWSAIDHQQDPSDAPDQPSAESSVESSGNQPEAVASPLSKDSGERSDANGDSPHAKGGRNADDASVEEAAPPRAAAESGEVSRPAATAGGKSKSKRIREFLADHPEVRNRDIVDALAEHGVTAADVANVRSQLRKKAEKQQRAKTRVAPDSGDVVKMRSAGRPRSAARAQTSRAAASDSSSDVDATASGEIAMSEIEAGLTFIEQAGGIERARQVVDLIARIRAINLQH